MATFDLNDDSVVCIIGSGAGGGTLGNELAQKGIKVVILEAGGRHEIPDFVNDEWASFAQLAWKDMRTTSGTWRVAHDFPNLPAWIVKSVGGSTVHWAGASLRFQDYEFKARSTYGNMAGANLADWPITLAEMEPWYAKAEDKMGTTGTNNIPRLPGNNNYKVLEAGARKLGYKEVHTGNMSINSQPRDDRGACQQIGFCFQGCKSGGKWSTLYTEIPKGEATGNLEVRPNAMALRIEHDAQGKVTGVVYVDGGGKQQRQKARVVAVAGNSLESPRLLLNSESAQVSRKVWRTARDRWDATTCVIPPAASTRCSTSRCTCIEAPPWRASCVTRRATIQSAASSVATSWRHCRSVCRSWRRSSIRARGDAASPVRSTTMPTWRACGSSARTCRANRTG